MLSSGQWRRCLMYRVVEEPLSADAIAQAVAVPEAGGVALFLGVVRNETAGRRVVALEYEAHLPMAEAKLKEIGEAVYARWPAETPIATLASPISFSLASAIGRWASYSRATTRRPAVSFRTTPRNTATPPASGTATAWATASAESGSSTTRYIRQRRH